MFLSLVIFYAQLVILINNFIDLADNLSLFSEYELGLGIFGLIIFTNSIIYLSYPNIIYVYILFGLIILNRLYFNIYIYILHKME